MWKYKGTKTTIKVGDSVKLAKKWHKQYGENGTVVILQGFITVEVVQNGERLRVDFDARSLSQA